jgi:hypothetical protein
LLPKPRSASKRKSAVCGLNGAALSWAATQVPEITVASQNFLKAGFLSAIQVELLFMIRGLHPVTNKGSPVSEFEKFCSET